MKPPRYVLKEGYWFACFGASGWIEARPEEMEGVFLEDVRLVDLLEVRFAGLELPALWVDASENQRLRMSCSNATFATDLPPGAVVLESEKRVSRAGYVESLRLTNHTAEALEGPLEILISFELADVAEVRGLLRDGWDRELETERPRDDTLFVHYRGPDDFQVSVLVSASRPFEWDGDGLIAFPLRLAPGEPFEVELRIGGLVGEGTLAAPTAELAEAEVERAVGAWRRSLPEVSTDDEETNELLARSADDLRMLWTWTGRETGFFAAGIPHFVTPFGRDGLLTSLEFLMMLPEQARWTLAELARHQGQKVHRLSEEEPGKIPHEIRRGERSRPDDYPYAYASIDASLLFPVLLDEYLLWSGDVDFVREMEPVLRGVLDWCATYGDTNGDGLLDYRDAKGGAQGLAHRGWKDGEKAAVTMGDGSEPAYPIAMIEFQGYARDALLGCERMFRLLNDPSVAEDCRTVADGLKEKFAEAFWWPEEGCLAMGVDGQGRRLDCVGTNQGHCLTSDIVAVEHREAVVERLMRPDSFSGFGLRTLSTGSVAYSPFRYQRGAVWPHDNALVAFGMHRRGFRTEANRIASGILSAGAQMGEHRLPELFSGLAADDTEGRAVELPISCRPQAWAAASPFHFLRGALGLFPDALARRVVLRPDLRGLPFGEVQVRRLRVAGGALSFDVRRSGPDDPGQVVPIAKEGEFVVDLG
ncbi:MAG: glycogen debranching N-terminal domain-containing protein [Planctomycetota bacterium]